jgi:cephalosporin-C deacetylase-like acetyl esterase
VAVKIYGELARPGYRIEKLMYETEPGILIPGLLFTPEGGPPKKLAILVADGKGKTASLARIEEFVLHGSVALSIDARGLGEGRGETREIFGDYTHSMTALLAGKTMVGMRVADILRGIDLLGERADVDAQRISAFGKGMGAVPMLYAAALDPRIGEVTLEEMLLSYQSMVDRRIHQQMFEHVVPGVLRYFDLPDLVKSIAPRPVHMVRAVNPLGHELR